MRCTATKTTIYPQSIRTAHGQHTLFPSEIGRYKPQQSIVTERKVRAAAVLKLMREELSPRCQSVMKQRKEGGVCTIGTFINDTGLAFFSTNCPHFIFFLVSPPIFLLGLKTLESQTSTLRNTKGKKKPKTPVPRVLLLIFTLPVPPPLTHKKKTGEKKPSSPTTPATRATPPRNASAESPAA